LSDPRETPRRLVTELPAAGTVDEEASRRAVLPFSELIMQLGAGVDRFDEGFARSLARELHERAGHVRLPAVDGLGLEDVMVTLNLDRTLRLVVSGNLATPGGGAVTVRWREQELAELPVELLTEPHPAPYTFATLDFSWRGRTGHLLEAAPPFPAGQQVTVRALATIGDRVELRVAALGLEASTPPETVAMVDAT